MRPPHNWRLIQFLLTLFVCLTFANPPSLADEKRIEEAGRHVLQTPDLLTVVRKQLPAGSHLLFPPVHTAAVPLKKSIVLFFSDPKRTGHPQAWVLIPLEKDKTVFDRMTLPPFKESPLLFEITIKETFDAAWDENRFHLVVLYDYYRTGSGTIFGSAGNVYRWDSRTFVIDETLSSRLVGCKTSQEAKKRLHHAWLGATRGD